MIPGLENAEFVRYGVMHRNTFLDAPRVLNAGLFLNEHPNVFFAGQITGFEGYITSPFSFRVPSAGTAQIHHSIPYLLPKFHCFPHYATKTCQMTQKSPGRYRPGSFYFI